MAQLGRDPDSMKILPGAFVVVGDTVEEAQAKRAKLDSLVHYDSGIATLNDRAGLRRLRLRSGRPAARNPRANASQSGRDRIVAGRGGTT